MYVFVCVRVCVYVCVCVLYVAKESLLNKKMAQNQGWDLSKRGSVVDQSRLAYSWHFKGTGKAS